MERNVLKMVVLSLFVCEVCFAIQDVNLIWRPDAKLSSLVKCFESHKNRQIVVDVCGTGDFNSIQQAINSIVNMNTERAVVLLKPGFYKERVNISKNRPLITIRGQDSYNTIISYNLYHDMNKPDGSGIYRSDCATVIVEGNDCLLENVTIENTFGPHPQALAAKINGDRFIAVNCRFLGWQDTLMANHGRQYYLNCFIEGGTDFIYGYAQAVFENCVIRSKENSHITAHAAVEPNLPTGFVFYNCRIITDDGIMTDLGRPWRPYAKVIYYNCWLDKGVKPAGWDNWRDPNREKTAFFAEYRSSGPGANPSSRVKWSHQLTDAQSLDYLPENFMRIEGRTVDRWLDQILDFRKTTVLKN